MTFCFFRCILKPQDKDVGFAVFKGGKAVKRREKGEGTIRKRTDGRWEGRYLDSAGNIKYIYSISKQEVREKLKEFSYIKNSTQFDGIGGDVPLDVYFKRYIDIKRYSIKERSINQIELAYNSHIKPILGKKILYNITINDIVMLKQSLEKKNLSDASQQNIMTHFKTLMNFATKEGLLKQNPFIYLSTAQKIKKKSTRRDLTDEEINYILNEAKLAKDYNDRIYLILCTLIYTGMRVGELCALRWNDFDIGNFQYVQIDESHTDSKYETTTKTESGNRTLPLNHLLSKQYKQLFAELKPSSLDSYVFITKRGNPYDSSLIALRLKFLKEQIRQKYNVDLSEVTPHYFRHTFATRGIANGVPLKDMQELLGHADTRTLMEVYMHTNNKNKMNSINIIWNTIQADAGA